MINANAVPCPLQCAVGVLCPLLPPRLQKLLVVPRPVLLAEALAVDVAHGQQDVTVRRVAFGVVHGEIGHHATVGKLAFGKAAN